MPSIDDINAVICVILPFEPVTKALENIADVIFVHDP